MKKLRANYMLPTKGQLSFKDTHKLKIKRWEKIVHANGDSKTARMADFKTKTVA
jgi:hypothetical protein